MEVLSIGTAYGEGAKLAIDKISKHLSTTSATESHIHDGIFYQATQFFPSVLDDSSVSLLIRTSFPMATYMRFRGFGGGDVRLRIYEDPTVVSVGSVIPVRNRNRSVSDFTYTSVFDSPDLSSLGDVLSDGYAPGGATSGGFQSMMGVTSGGKDEGFEEWMLPPGRDYVFRATNLAGSAKPIFLMVGWFENKLG